MRWSRFNVRTTIDGREVLLNMLSQSVVRLRSDLFQKVESGIPSGGLSNDTFAAVVSKLKQLGFIVDDDFDDVAYMKYFTTRLLFSNNFMGAFISFGSSCNLRCTYCYQDMKPEEGKLLSMENWGALFCFLQRRIKHDRVKELGVALFGGEPLLNYDVMCRAIEDLKSMPEVTTSIALITNGTLLTEQRLRFLADKIESIQITIDGPKEVHDKRRVHQDGRGTFDEIVEAILRACEVLKGKVVVRVNVTPSTVKSIHCLLDFFERCGIKERIAAIDFAPGFSPQSEISSNSCETRVTQHLQGEIADLMLYAAETGWPISKAFKVGPCMYVHPSSFAVDENLKVYKCPGYLYDKPDAFIDKAFDLKITNPRWYRSLATPPTCVDDCIYSPMCWGGCRWMAGKADHTRCGSEGFTSNLKKLLRAYVISRYTDTKKKGVINL